MMHVIKLYIILTLSLLSSFMLNRIKHFHNKHALAGNPYPRGHGICNFGSPVLGHHFYRVRLPDLYKGVEKKTAL